MDGEIVNVGAQYPAATPGSAGLNSQLPGAPATVSSTAGATGETGAGNLVQRDTK